MLGSAPGTTRAIRKAQFTPEEERAKADNPHQYFRICFAHPTVTGILMWRFWEGANWIPQSSLYKRDWAPAAKACLDLVTKRWWMRCRFHNHSYPGPVPTGLKHWTCKDLFADAGSRRIEA
jgi:hypothetical protein